jgi:hypothetical protein
MLSFCKLVYIFFLTARSKQNEFKRFENESIRNSYAGWAISA